MSLSLLFLIFIGVIVLLMFVVPAVMFGRNSEEAEKPYKTSWVILGLIVFNWLLFLTDFYSFIPSSIADTIFTPVWVILCVAGMIAVISEFKNNKSFAVSLAGLTIISLMFTVLSYGIGEM